MATRTPPAPFKATVRNARTKMDIQGTIRTGVVHSFYMVDSREEREAILEEMREVHEELNSRPERSAA